MTDIRLSTAAGIGSSFPPFVIAEMSGNHNGSLERALKIVDAAADSGCHALKIQTYTADTMTLDVRRDEFLITDPESLWKGSALYDLYTQAATPWEWHEPIFARCRERGLVGFSTPFDATALAFLESLNVPLYKIASFENVDIPLIRRVAATGKPLIISTGLASLEEIDEAVAAARDGGCRDLVVLKCTSAYPAPEEAANLATLADLRERTGALVGLSDHTLGIGVSVGAAALGAHVIEKHFTLRRADGGVDSAFSIEPGEMRALVMESARAWKAVGKVSYALSAQEKNSLQFRRSLYVARDLKAGDVLTEQNIRAVRPGRGLPPKHQGAFLGKRAVRDAVKGTAVTWDLIGRREGAS